MSRFCLVALDVDGTLLNDAGEVGARTRRRVSEVRSAGVAVVLVTGRPFAAVRTLARQLGLRLPVICHHGACAHEPDSGRIRFRRSLEPSLAAELAAFVTAAGAFTAGYVDGVLVAGRVDEAAAAYYRAHGVTARTVGNLSGFLARPGVPGPDMLVVRGEPGEMASLARELEVRWNGRIELQRPGPRALDVVAAGAGKEAAVARLAGDLRIPREAVLAIGNGDNDAGLLAWSGLGVAVANAAPALRAAAAWIAPDNNHDGVAAALERFVLAEST